MHCAQALLAARLISSLHGYQQPLKSKQCIRCFLSQAPCALLHDCFYQLLHERSRTTLMHGEGDTVCAVRCTHHHFLPHHAHAYASMVGVPEQ